MSRELLLHHPEIRNYTTIWMDTLRNGTFGLSNTNKLIRFYDGATGLKTGYTDKAGYCISATAERDGMELIAVIMDGETADKRNTDAKALLNYGFSTYTLTHITPAEPLPALPVTLGAEDTVAVVLPADNCAVLTEKAAAANLTQTIDLPASIAAPVAAGDRLGTLTVHDGDIVIKTLPLLAQSDVPKLTWGQMAGRMLGMAIFC